MNSQSVVYCMGFLFLFFSFSCVAHRSFACIRCCSACENPSATVQLTRSFANSPPNTHALHSFNFISFAMKIRIITIAYEIDSKKNRTKPVAHNSDRWCKEDNCFVFVFGSVVAKTKRSTKKKQREHIFLLAVSRFFAHVGWCTHATHGTGLGRLCNVHVFAYVVNSCI